MKSHENVSRRPGSTTERILDWGMGLEKNRCKAGGPAPALLPWDTCSRPGKPSAGPGRRLHLGRCTPLWPSGAGYMLGRDKASCKPAELPAARSSMTPHAIVNQLKTILNSQASEQNVSECPLKIFSTDSCVVYSI